MTAVTVLHVVLAVLLLRADQTQQQENGRQLNYDCRMSVMFSLKNVAIVWAEKSLNLFRRSLITGKTPPSTFEEIPCWWSRWVCICGTSSALLQGKQQTISWIPSIHVWHCSGVEPVHCPATEIDDSFIKDSIEELSEKTERISNETKGMYFTWSKDIVYYDKAVYKQMV